MYMVFKNKKELTECINEVIKLVPSMTVGKLVGRATSLENAGDLMNQTVSALADENSNNDIGTQLILLSKRYTDIDCYKCGCPESYCKCAKEVLQ